MRVECTEPGFEGNFIELSDVWTRGEMRRFWRKETNDEDRREWLSLLQGKITAIHLEAVNGDPITRADQYTDEELERIDNRLWLWVQSALLKAVMDVNDLGNALRRRLWDTSGEKTDTTDRQTN